MVTGILGPCDPKNLTIPRFWQRLTSLSVYLFVFGRLFDLLLMYLAFLYLTVFEEI